jgi:hypothetical protein
MGLTELLDKGRDFGDGLGDGLGDGQNLNVADGDSNGRDGLNVDGGSGQGGEGPEGNSGNGGNGLEQEHTVQMKYKLVCTEQRGIVVHESEAKERKTEELYQESMPGWGAESGHLRDIPMGG